MAKQTKPILDTKTNTEYESMYAAGKALATLVPQYTGEARLVWFAIARAFPDRFKTRSTSGEWVALNDASVPVIHRNKRSETPEAEEQRLLARIAELRLQKDANEAAGNGKTSNKVSGAVKMKTAPRPTAVAEETEETEVEGEAEAEGTEEQATAPTPGPSKKLAGNMRKA